MPTLRLNKILAQAGLTSRRGADRLILDGRVRVNGRVTRELGSLADPAADVIEVDDAPIAPAESPRYVLLHKPAGYVTSVRDPHARPVVTDLVRGPERLYPVGRLDADVEGLLLLTNDGALTHRLLHPRYGLPRVYDAEVAGHVTPADLARWREGVELDDGWARPRAVAIAASGRERSRVTLTFAEGRKHEVKRYCEALGHRVLRLRRVAFGPITLRDLPVGASRALTTREVSALRAAVAASSPCASSKL
jgi:23S rRNA pseudouridine2605 synthase